jgi:hypothetical protein
VADPGPRPQRFHDVLVEFADLLEAHGVAYMLVGAVAVGVWGTSSRWQRVKSE